MIIDLRSDTVTKPTPAMLEAMMNARVGDDVFGEDPTILVKNLTLILDSDALRGKENLLEYIDLRFGNRMYYKFSGVGAGASTTKQMQTH